VAESCDGTGPDCPADGKSTAVCRAAAGPCDAAESCDGGADDCPGDGLLSSGTECRPAAGACDVGEACDGLATTCPGDVVLSSGTECRAVAGACDVAEACDGVSAACPADTVSASGIECRAVAGTCDTAEACDGLSPACPADAFDSGTECRASAGVCDVAESCDGTGSDCPADAKSTAECRVAAGVCDVAEACDGSADACPADAFAPDTTECRPSTGSGDDAEFCTGESSMCPADGGTDGDGDGVPDTIDNCVGVPNGDQADADDDQVGDECDPCSNVVPVFASGTKIKLTKQTTPPGDDGLLFKGVIAVPTTPTIDPAANGIRVLLTGADDSVVLDATIGGGSGWKVNAKATRWSFKSPGGTQGITRVKIAAKKNAPGTLKFSVKGKGGSFAPAAGALPVVGTLVVDAPIARTGQCGEATPACQTRAKGKTILCK
jgi:hypothetical protein